ncbi:hypothetical protein [Conexibacter sp. CPCC 206217]|uniref:hypothetical protein n=1 Tax=Conexibacter sp. CPCC 206217 TaxID=3064574 RepID=UPI0027238FEC|nr:hypothetical protein [Conexibacter sp. CPCC 206217]MDO8209892.1 hypothetical protein [Conexibacter sp. CPCC 206217]
MRIGFVTNPHAVNSNYRAYQPMDELERRGHSVYHNRSDTLRYDISALRQCDVVLIHRYTDQVTQRAIQQLRRAGVGLVWDNDDDLTNVPKSHPHYGLFGGLNRQRIVAELARTVSFADIVTTPSEVLASQYRAIGAVEVRVIENYIPAEFARLGPIRHEGIVVVCLAGLEHQIDYQTLRLREVLQRLLDEHSDLGVLNLGLGLGLPSNRSVHRPLLGFLDLVPNMVRADIGIAPNIDIPWNQARSNVKLKEYGAAGLAWLASPIGAYPPLGEGEGGRLVADDDWYRALNRLIVDSRDRRKLAKRALKWARAQTIQRHVGLWEQVFADAAERARARRMGQRYSRVSSA